MSYLYRLSNLFFVLLFFVLMSCSGDKDTKFLLLDSTQTNIDFINEVENTPEFNVQNYLYFYDGGGVATGDINIDGLPDLFFTASDGPNKLYLNKGDFVFEDITESAGIEHQPGSWSTGVTMADVNGDGLLDIYVSQVTYLNKQGPNKLYINNGDLTFTERAAEYGLNFEGYSTQAAFFDYDADGDLDMFLLNHSFHSEDTYGPVDQLREKTHPQAGDRLFRNDESTFTDVTEEAGIISSALGYGLGLAVTDINRDGFMDVYIGNDFHEDDYFYINNGDGTFSNSLYEMVGHTASASMGNDIGDINNDGWSDIVSLDMSSRSHEIFMTTGGPDMMMIAEAKRRFGFGPNNNRNTLQINRGNTGDGLPRFSETAYASGIARTDWSWSSLLADFDNDGFQDLHITNGLPKRPNDLDYVAALQRLRNQFSGEERDKRVYSLVTRMDPVHIHNQIFMNNKNLTFQNVTEDWGMDRPSYSNGAVYVDLNDDGNLDIVTNNINEEAYIYRNQAEEQDSLHYLKIKLNGNGGNSTGIGSKVIAYSDGNTWYREQMPTRGFQSSVDHTLHIGLGEHASVDSLLVIWPNRQYQKLRNIQADQTLMISQNDSQSDFNYELLNQVSGDPLFRNVTELTGIENPHEENTFNDFGREPLMPYKLSTQGPALAVADVNSDGLDDYYLGGAKGYAGKLFIQQNDGFFIETQNDDFDQDRHSEDVDAIFFDANGDNLKDLYVVSGGNEYVGQIEALLDRLYLNQGGGEFLRATENIPQFWVNGSTVSAADYNGDGSIDLFVGGHTIPWRYGVAPQSFLLENDGEGMFRIVTRDAAPKLHLVGNVTSSLWFTQPDKSLPDLIVAGEWMGVHYFENDDGQLIQKTTEYGLENLNGLWQSMHLADLDGNGTEDIVLGNFGVNSRLEASNESPLKLYINDYNENGQTAPVIAHEVDGTERPFEQLDEILAQIPEVQQEIRSYRDYAGKTIEELFTEAKLDSALQKEIQELHSIILYNNGDNSFTKKNLPVEAQLFPIFGIYSDDLNGDGIQDILLGGNLYDVKPSMGGRQDSGYGLVLIGRGDGEFKAQHYHNSGFYVPGETRAILPIKMGDQSRDVIVARNNQTPLIFQINSMD